MRVIYVSKKGGKPLRLGMNQAKRIAKSADRRDQLSVQKNIGFGLPRQHSHHQQLVRQRHAYYGDVYAEAERVRLEASQPRGESPSDQEPGDAAGALPESAPGADHQQRDDGA